jgi:hypothetical protein
MRIATMVLLLGACLSGCSGPTNLHRGEDYPEVHVDEDKEVQLAVYTYLIKDVLQPVKGQVLYILANEKVCQILALKFPFCRILSRANIKVEEKDGGYKTSLDPGALILDIESIEINGNQAKVSAEYSNDSAVVFYMNLEKEHEWRIKGEPMRMIVDMPAPH